MSAISCSFAALSSKNGISLNNNSVATRSQLNSNSVTTGSQLSANFGLPSRANIRFSAKNCLRASCLGDTKASVVTGKSWDKLILKSETPVLVEFYASWCGPCRMVHRVIDEIATDYSGKLNCFVLDADQEAHIAESYDVKAVPVVLLFKNGEKRDFIVGTMPKDFYVTAIEKVGKFMIVDEAVVHIIKLQEPVQELEQQKHE